MTARAFEDTITTDFKDRMDYGGYLCLNQIFASQNPLSNPPHHDEMLFIIQHQTSELWMKLIVHELRAAVAFIQNDKLEPTFKILARVKHIQRMLFEQWAVLETLTPTEYAQFRGVLGSSSGFQSYHFRMIEFLLGNKDDKAVDVFKHAPEVQAELRATLEGRSIYDEFLAHLHRRGLMIPESAIQRDFTQPYEANPEIVQVFKRIYEHPELHWDAYEMAEKLVDVEEHFVLWRFRHMKTVERIIGFKTGTGGSSGVPFLLAGLKVRLFPELWDVRTEIGR